MSTHHLKTFSFPDGSEFTVSQSNLKRGFNPKKAKGKNGRGRPKGSIDKHKRKINPKSLRNLHWRKTSKETTVLTTW
jgi:hypothetical protein